MKKLIAMLLAIVMVLSFATVAFADETTGPELKMESKVETVGLTLRKLYEVTGETNDVANSLHPQEVLTFTSTPSKDNPDYKTNYGDDLSKMNNLSISTLDVDGQNGTMSITLPKYTAVGEYEYTIKETAANNQGVTYSTEEIKITVLVTYDYEYKTTDNGGIDTDDTNYGLKTEVVLSAGSVTDNVTDNNGLQYEGNKDYKLDTFTNKYDVNTLTVQKKVTGNLGDKENEFKIKVTFNSTKPVLSDIAISGGSDTNVDKAITGMVDSYTTAGGKTTTLGEWTKVKSEDVVTGYTTSVEIYLADTDTITFSNIPVGVTYVVEEDDVHLANGTTIDKDDVNIDYTVTYAGETVDNESANTARKASGTIAKDEADSVTVSNEKSTTVETGITLDSVPYIVMLAVAACGMVVFMTKKRHED